MKADKDRLYRDVDFLASLSPPRNYRHTAALEKVCCHLEAAFTEMGARPERQSWQAAGNTYHNIIASYRPEQPRRLVVGAHYDVCGDGPGADDNASAVAGLLETARMVFSREPDTDYRIDFVAYCLEEPPFFGTKDMGSYVHARSLHESGADVIGMISYEMIGYFSDVPGSQPFPGPELAQRYPHTANFIIVVGIEEYRAFNEQVYRLMREGAGIDVQIIHFPGKESLAGLSDQRSYWAFGWPALMINDTAFVRNPNYHTKGDTIDTLDFGKMTEVVNSAYQAVTGLS